MGRFGEIARQVSAEVTERDEYVRKRLAESEAAAAREADIALARARDIYQPVLERAATELDGAGIQAKVTPAKYADKRATVTLIIPDPKYNGGSFGGVGAECKVTVNSAFDSLQLVLRGQPDQTNIRLTDAATLEDQLEKMVDRALRILNGL
jgi:hypothetical protein